MEYNPEVKQCQNCKNDFTIEPDDFSFYEKIKVPPPTFCSECRMQRRLSWRNDMSLYNRRCDLCEKSVVSIYSPDSNVSVFCNRCWWSDKWDPSSYAQDYDFTKQFFNQIIELFKKVPQLSLVNDNGIGSINSEYTQDFSFAKNCYMVFIAWKVENAMYSHYLISGKDIVDSMNVLTNSEWIYECIHPDNCYNVKYSQLVKNCQDSNFLYDCNNCSNCFICSGLRNKNYCFKNKQYSKEEYIKILNEYKLNTFSGVEKAQLEFDNFILNTPRKFSNIIHSYSCTGDSLLNSKNSYFCFNAQSLENCKWISDADSPIDSYDLSTGGESSECYEGITSDHSNKNLFGIYSWKCQNIDYSLHCHSSKYIFGCVGLRNKKYCILNKQYTQEEYEKLIPKIKQHMIDMPYIDKNGRIYKYGEFFPSELSPFGYNETVAQEKYKISKNEALINGFNWRDNTQKTEGMETILPEDISDSIEDINNLIINEIFKCIDCSRNYKIVLQEFEFYKKMKIPIPRRCFYCRHENRLKRKNPYHLWHRTCMHEGCTNEFETTYAPDRPEIVYCESCYQKEVY